MPITAPTFLPDGTAVGDETNITLDQTKISTPLRTTGYADGAKLAAKEYNEMFKELTQWTKWFSWLTNYLGGAVSSLQSTVAGLITTTIPDLEAQGTPADIHTGWGTATFDTGTATIAYALASAVKIGKTVIMRLVVEYSSESNSPKQIRLIPPTGYVPSMAGDGFNTGLMNSSQDRSKVVVVSFPSGKIYISFGDGSTVLSGDNTFEGTLIYQTA